MSAIYEYSFIVPVYNAEKYIGENIESLLRQGDKCEIILVDDGSDDGSGRICDAYAEKYGRIRAYHVRNRGPSAARNFGLDRASGRYCIFVDSDDYVSDSLAGSLGKEISVSDADVIFFNIIKVFCDGTQRRMSEGLTRDGINGKPINEVLAALAKCSKFPASTGGKALKTEFLKRCGIRFAEGMVGEDIDWTLQIVTEMSSAAVCGDGCYYYRISPVSRRSYGRAKSLDDQLSIVEKWLEASEKSEYGEYIAAFLAYQYAVALPFYGALPESEREGFRTRIKKLRCLLSKGNTPKLRLIRAAVFLLGTDGASKLLYRYVAGRDKQKD